MVTVLKHLYYFANKVFQKFFTYIFAMKQNVCMICRAIIKKSINEKLCDKWISWTSLYLPVKLVLLPQILKLRLKYIHHKQIAQRTEEIVGNVQWNSTGKALTDHETRSIYDVKVLDFHENFGMNGKHV